MKTKRPGAGRKKGQLTKVDASTFSPSHAEQGDYRGDVRQVYQDLRSLAWNEGVLEMGWEKSLDAYRAMTTIVKATRKKDVSFFNELAGLFSLMVANDAAPETLPAPPADTEFFWLGKLREYHEAESNTYCPPYFSESLSKVLSLPRADRPPLTLKQIGDFLKQRTGHRPSLSSLSAKAKIVGLSVHLRFGKIR